MKLILLRKEGFHPGQLGQLEHHSLPQDVAGWIPGQGTYVGYGFDPQLGPISEATSQCFSLSLSFPLSLKSINIYSGEDLKTKERKGKERKEKKKEKRRNERRKEAF